MIHQLKGDVFSNRYRITGTLTTISPLHIGTGDERPMEFRNEEEKKKTLEKAGKIPSISTIITDYRGKPLIPGSTLRGVLRNWLLTVLEGVGAQWAAERDYRDEGLLDLDQAKQIHSVRNTFSRLELLFGTPLNAGKVEVWDAPCSTGDLRSGDTLLGWDNTRLTYVDTSLAIDPARGTAKKKLLYKADVVPPGVTFELNLVAQNLSDEELGLLLLALEGFNSQIYPIQVGARGGRGYGRLRFEMASIYRLESGDVTNWLKKMLEEASTAEAPTGYFGLPKLSDAEQEQKIRAVKDKLANAIGG